MIKRILVLTALVSAATTAAAQAAATTNAPVAIVLVDELPFAQAKAVVIRRKAMKPQNVVLVTKRTAPGDLTRAMATLARARTRSGDEISTNMVAPIPENRSGEQSKDFMRARKDLDQLRTARPRFIEGVGSRPVLFSRLTQPARAKRRG